MLKRRPLIKPEKTPHEIIGSNAETIILVLKGWQTVQGKVDWKEFTAKSGSKTKEMMAAVFSELRRNGYYNPRVYDDKIIVDYICFRKGDMKSKTADLCTLCERPCKRREEVDTGLLKWKKSKDENYREQKPCWA